MWLRLAVHGGGDKLAECTYTTHKTIDTHLLIYNRAQSFASLYNFRILAWLCKLGDV